MTSSGLMKRSGCSTRPSSALPDLGLRGVGDGLGLDPRDAVEPVSAMARKASSRTRTTIATRIRRSLPPIRRPAPAGSRPAPGRASGGAPAGRARGRASRRSRRARRGRGRARAARRGRRAGRARRRACRRGRRLLGGDRRADDDVAEQHRDATRRAGSPSSSSSGNDSTSVGPGRAEVLGVELGDLVAVDEGQRQLAPPLLGASTSRARRVQRSTSTSTSSCSSAPTTTTSSVTW